jgi:hypothetical protein
MCKKQQMRWSPTGAQNLLHVRTAMLNRRLARYTGLAALVPVEANDDKLMPRAA